MPTTAAGRQAATTLAQSAHVALRSCAVLRGEKGLSLPKNITHTARIAPSWMTTRNMSQKSRETSRVTNWSSSSMWPVDETGSHSVMPSTSPKSAALRSSMISMQIPSSVVAVVSGTTVYGICAQQHGELAAQSVRPIAPPHRAYSGAVGLTQCASYWRRWAVGGPPSRVVVE